MHCKDTMVELDVDPEDPEVLIMTCLVSTDHNSNDDDDDDLENPKLFAPALYIYAYKLPHVPPGPTTVNFRVNAVIDSVFPSVLPTCILADLPVTRWGLTIV